MHDNDTHILPRRLASWQDRDFSLPYASLTGPLVLHDKHYSWETSDDRTLRLTVDQLFTPAAFEAAFIKQLGRRPWDNRPTERAWHRFLNATPIIDQRSAIEKRAA